MIYTELHKSPQIGQKIGNRLMSHVVDISRMSQLDRDAQFGVLGPDITGLVGYSRNQITSLEGYTKSYIGDLVRSGIVGVEIRWLCPVWDALNSTSVHGVFVGTVTECVTWQSDLPYVSFVANGVIRTVKSNCWVFLPNQ